MKERKEYHEIVYRSHRLIRSPGYDMFFGDECMARHPEEAIRKCSEGCIQTPPCRSLYSEVGFMSCGCTKVWVDFCCGQIDKVTVALFIERETFFHSRPSVSPHSTRQTWGPLCIMDFYVEPSTWMSPANSVVWIFVDETHEMSLDYAMT